MATGEWQQRTAAAEWRRLRNAEVRRYFGTARPLCFFVFRFVSAICVSEACEHLRPPFGFRRIAVATFSLS